MTMAFRRFSTPPGQHRPVLFDEVITALEPHEGDVAVDCTLGAAGHSIELLRRVGPTGRLIGCDLDARNIDRVRPILDAIGNPYELHATNFAGIAAYLPVGADIV